MNKKSPTAWRRKYRPLMEPTDLPLSPREKTIVTMIAEGHTSWQIAQILGLSKKTVECHRMHAMAKTGAGCLAHLVRYAIRTGLIAN